MAKLFEVTYSRNGEPLSKFLVADSLVQLINKGKNFSTIYEYIQYMYFLCVKGQLLDAECGPYV